LASAQPGHSGHQYRELQYFRLPVGFLLLCAAFSLAHSVWRKENRARETAEARLTDILSPRLQFAREIRKEGGGGRYWAYTTVRNTSLSEKMVNCRCEVVDLKDASGQVVQRNIGLGTTGQQAEHLGGRFNLDQGSETDIPFIYSCPIRRA
jgi:hypothetical protein